MLVICSVVGFLGLLSAASGFAAEAKRIKVNHPIYISVLFSICLALCIYTFTHVCISIDKPYSVQVQIGIFKIEVEEDRPLK